MAIANNSITSRFGARPLPELDLRGRASPPTCERSWSCPIILTTREAIAEHVEHLEIHHLASLDGDVSFALLSDWADAASERVAGDEALLERRSRASARLNLKYGPGAGGRSLPAAASATVVERRHRASGWVGSASAASCTS